MGIGGISMWQLLILLVIVVLVFGTKKLRNLGGDLGSAIKGFRKGMEDDDKNTDSERLEADPGPESVDATHKSQSNEPASKT